MEWKYRLATNQVTSQKVAQLPASATSDPALKKWKESGASKYINENCVFSVFPAKILSRFCHAVLDCREHQGLPSDLFDHARSIAIAGATVIWRLFWFLPIFCLNIAKKKFARYLVTIYTPKGAHSRSFVTGGSVFAQQRGTQKSISWGS